MGQRWLEVDELIPIPVIEWAERRALGVTALIILGSSRRVGEARQENDMKIGWPREKGIAEKFDYTFTMQFRALGKAVWRVRREIKKALVSSARRMI